MGRYFVRVQSFRQDLLSQLRVRFDFVSLGSIDLYIDCFNNRPSEKVIAVLDQPVLSDGTGGQRSRVKQKTNHPTFNTGRGGLDVTLLELETPIQLKYYPSLADRSSLSAGSTVFATG